MDKVELQDVLIECKEHTQALWSLALLIGNSKKEIDKGLLNADCVIIESLENKLNTVIDNITE